MVERFDILYGSARGATHRQKNKPNQDALNIQFIEGGGIFAIADGHGSDVCFRSDIGSKIATKVAVEAAVDLNFSSKQPLDGDQFMHQWAKVIVSNWAAEVLNHLKNKPFKEKEVEGLSEPHTKALAGNSLIAYGSTLAAVMILNEMAYTINLGDSDVLIKSNDSTQNIILVDQYMVGGLTYSLSTTGCLGKFKYESTNLMAVDAMMLSTDGYKNSFATTKDFYKVLADIETMYINSGHLPLHTEFESWLKDTGSLGSGDDITAIVLLAKRR